MKSFEELCAGAIAEAAPYRWVVQQARCRACGNVHERELGLMREHAPGSWIRVDAKDKYEHANAPVMFQETQLAWCEACHTKSAAELTRDVRTALDVFGNTNELAKALASALERFNKSHTKEHFHHAAN